MTTSIVRAARAAGVIARPGDMRGGVDMEPRPDVTLDVLIPRLDGWAVLSALKADPALAGISVIMLTMVDDRRCWSSTTIRWSENCSAGNWRLRAIA